MATERKYGQTVSAGGTITGENAGRGYTTDNDGNLVYAPELITQKPATPAAPATTTNSHRVSVPDHLKGGEPNGGYNFEDTTDAAIRSTATSTVPGKATVTTTIPSASTGSTGSASDGNTNFLEWLFNNGAGTSGNPLQDIFGGSGSSNTDSAGADGAAQNNYEQTLKEAYEAQAAARAEALENMIASYGSQSALIDQQYDQAVRDAYANARLSAIGNNEVLAAQGLAGGLYQSPTSGYSETSRVMQDNAMRSNMFAAQMARNQAKAEVERDILQLRAQGMYDQADLAAAQMEALINLQMQLDEQKYQREIDAWNMQQASK